MIKVGLKPKKVSCYTPEQQEYYDKLPPRQRAYVEFRSQGYGKTDSYIKAGYTKSKNSGQNAWILENKDPRLADLIETRLKVKQAKDILNADSEIGKQIDALAEVKTAENALEVLEQADGETMKQIKFFRDIVSGKIKTVKTTKMFNKHNELVSTKVEEISDIETRMKARKDLDRLLGIGKLVDIGKIEAGSITINFVDASKADEANNEKNKIYMDLSEKTETIGDEVVIVEEETTEIVKEKKPRVSNKGKPVEDDESIDEGGGE